MKHYILHAFADNIHWVCNCNILIKAIHATCIQQVQKMLVLPASKDEHPQSRHMNHTILNSSNFRKKSNFFVSVYFHFSKTQ